MVQSGTCQFPALPSSVTQARHFVAGTLDEATPQLRIRAELVVHELFLETLRHAEPHATLQVTVTSVGAAMRITVSCDSPAAHPSYAGSGASGGLRLMELLVGDWGRRHVPGQVSTWAMIDDARGPRPSARWLCGLLPRRPRWARRADGRRSLTSA